jgi:hypothetical protein
VGVPIAIAFGKGLLASAAVGGLVVAALDVADII